ncbi:hypothetical protein SAMN05877838_0256 [Hoeflea halophila]|uniref:ElaB/YqjD/DUF883 family membrane-anchored ribosome-binding protein n=1 Tax=Hoeflea halophila TaxID=714899 RepID=A0A286HL34_9HYPH|nr:hypothetical protein [Hoeflea halophila]SOE08533.1 hypothetical protein SAMN05877838_0256 [Hoeflea halophila]
MTSSKSETMANATDNIKQKISETGEKLKSEARHQSDEAKSRVADEMSNVASALHGASGEFDTGTLQAKLLNQIADGISGAADTVRNKDMSEVVTDVQGFARSNPAVFLGGAALLGFVASRFAKASESRDHDRQPSTTPSYPAATTPASPTATASSAQPVSGSAPTSTRRSETK